MAGQIIRDPRLAIYGHAGFDRTLTTQEVVREVGGAAYYAALAASLRSRSVGIVTVVGRDFPISYLHSLRIDTEGVSIKLGQSAVFSQTYDDHHDLVRFSANLGVCQQLTPMLIPPRYLRSRIFFITAAPPSQQRMVLAWLADQKFPGHVAIDTTLHYIDGFRALLRDCEQRINILFVNAHEYRMLDLILPTDITVIVKRGAEGASLCQGGLWAHISAPKADRIRSTTGAGDILAGTCLSAVADGEQLCNALAEGVERATESVQGPNVEHLRRRHVDLARSIEHGGEGEW